MVRFQGQVLVLFTSGPSLERMAKSIGFRVSGCQEIGFGSTWADLVSSQGVEIWSKLDQFPDPMQPQTPHGVRDLNRNRSVGRKRRHAGTEGPSGVWGLHHLGMNHA